MIDTRGVIYKGRKEGMNKYKERHACDTELRTLEEAIKGADIFIGVSSADLLTNDMVKSMNEKPVIFGNLWQELINPTKLNYAIFVWIESPS